jgi:glycosyltransferase involved in cell wall biosynthesis
MTTNGTAPTKILLYGDVAVPTGFGRIGQAVGPALQARGYHVMGACHQYDGLLPHNQSFWIAALQGKDEMQALSGIVAAYQPDLILSLQDFPYHEGLRHAAAIDWSTTAHVVITPVDGVPIAQNWVRLVDQFDGFMTISEFGVEAFRNEGKRAVLCPPGVDMTTFKRLSDDERAALRAKLGIPPDAFVVGVMAMNQGRKGFPTMLEGFAQAFKDVPGARLLLDCDKVSIAGWDLPQHIISRVDIDPAKVLFREDAMRAGVLDLNDRYNLLDAHMVLAHREGFGLPHVEAMATGIPSVALDYCSGREIIGDDARGVLIKAHKSEMGTWGGAWDYNADMEHLAERLRWLYDHPAERAAMGARALAFAKTRTWDKATTAVLDVVAAALDKRKDDIAKRKARQPLEPDMPPVTRLTPAGMVAPQQTIIQLNAPIHVHGNNAKDVGEEIAAAVGGEVVLMEEGQGDE